MTIIDICNLSFILLLGGGTIVFHCYKQGKSKKSEVHNHEDEDQMFYGRLELLIGRVEICLYLQHWNSQPNVSLFQPPRPYKEG
jgi:ATP-dependent protease Clp ATPase subunit